MFFVRPDESFTYGSATGTVESADYQPSWILDGRSNRPARGATGLTLAMTALASRTVSLAAIVNHNIAGTSAISGGVTATIPAATVRADGAYLNPWVSITPVSASTATITVTGTPSIIGEVILGTKRTMKDFLPDSTFEPSEPFPWEEGSAIPPDDSGVLAPRRLSGDLLLNDSEYADLVAWEQSTRRGTRPTLLVPNTDVVDALYGVFRYTVKPNKYVSTTRRAATTDRSIRNITLEFVEIPLLRWPA